MGFWSTIGLVSKKQLDEHVLNQAQQFEDLKKIIEESNLANQKRTSELFGELAEKFKLHEQHLVSCLEENHLKTKQEILQNIQDVNDHVTLLDEKREKTLLKELKAIKENMTLLEEVLKLNWANQLLDQLETNIDEFKLSNTKKR